MKGQTRVSNCHLKCTMDLTSRFNDASSHTSTKEIQLWSAAAQPIESSTTARDSYRAHPLPPTPAQPQHAYTPNPHRCDGTTTTQDEYRAWRVQPPVPPPPAATPINPHRFEGITTARDSYRAHPLPPTPAQPQHAYTPNPHRCDGTTTMQDSYRVIQLPRVQLPALGIELKGGLFHELIPAGTPSCPPPTLVFRIFLCSPTHIHGLTSSSPGSGSIPPVTRSAVITTVADNQTTVAIKVHAFLDDGQDPFLLGSFELSEIPPTREGRPQVVPPRVAARP